MSKFFRRRKFCKFTAEGVTEIDWVRQGLNQVFVFRNPQVQAECGCGESFTTSIQP